MKEGGFLERFLSDFPMSKTSHSSISYVMGPFESLNEDVIGYLLRKLYENYELFRPHLLVLLHNRLLRLDLSFIQKKKNAFFNQHIASFIGNTCYVSCFRIFGIIYKDPNDNEPNSLISNQKAIDLT